MPRAVPPHASGHVFFMRQAIALAKKGIGLTSPNPAVGAVVVRGGAVISKGFHRKAGLAHAERAAIERIKKINKDSTLYVTLEPCCHYGRTPPCTDLIIGSGIKSVVIGAVDPNPKVRGKGIRALRRAGIQVTTGVLKEECGALNEQYEKHITTGLPFVALKLACTLDGKIATKTGESRWITGIEARRFAHRLRSVYDAVMVGSNTVLKDDPELTVRHIRGRNPKRIVLDSLLSTPLDARVFDNIGNDGGDELIIFTTSRAKAKNISRAREKGATVIIAPGAENGLSLGHVLKELGRFGVTGVLVEGGATLAAAFLKQGLVDRLMICVSPMIIGSDGVSSVGALGIERLKQAIRPKALSVKRLGADILFNGKF